MAFKNLRSLVMIPNSIMKSKTRTWRTRRSLKQGWKQRIIWRPILKLLIIFWTSKIQQYQSLQCWEAVGKVQITIMAIWNVIETEHLSNVDLFAEYGNLTGNLYSWVEGGYRAPQDLTCNCSTSFGLIPLFYFVPLPQFIPALCSVMAFVSLCWSPCQKVETFPLPTWLWFCFFACF